VTPAAPLRVAVNGRYASRPVTGVERVAHELVMRLPASLESPSLDVLAPSRPVDGVRGHAWEQLVLPGRFHRSQADVLLSLCNFGPVRVSRQILLLHDAAPFLLPDTFDRRYAAAAKLIQRRLARRCRLATVSEHSRRDIASIFGLDPALVALVPPAVGPPFLHAEPGEDSGGCVFVGGHDKRKNLDFLLAMWPTVHAETGATLDVVGRSDSATLDRTRTRAVEGVRWHSDPPDEALASLFRSSRLLLSPSRYEGFGLPLLEAMACGTPFLATPTGAAEELAVEPDEQLLPLDHGEWTARIVNWLRRDLRPVRAASRERARAWTWESSASRLATLVREVAAGSH
jgi:glycosyltransferase involved in cell wall biosynthesis